MPTRQQIHIDRPLTNLSLAYTQTADKFIADKIFPVIPVKKQSDTYFVYKREDFFRDEARERAKGTESAGGSYDVELAPPYFARKHAFHIDVFEEDRVNADDPLQPNRDATEIVTHKLLLRRENLWAKKYFGAGIWGTDYTGVDATPGAGEFLKFSNPASDPINTLINASTEMARTTGHKPNTLVLSPSVYNALRNHPDMIDRIKYTQKGVVSHEMMASLLEVENIYVPWAIQNSAGVGKDAQMDFILEDAMLLLYVEKNPGLKKASAGYTFAWTGLMGANAIGGRVVRIPMPWLGLDTERIEAEMAYDQQIVAKDLGMYFEDVI